MTNACTVCLVFDALSYWSYWPLTLQVGFTVHWASCLYYFLASVSDFEEDSWVVRIGIQDENNVFR